MQGVREEEKEEESKNKQNMVGNDGCMGEKKVIYKFSELISVASQISIQSVYINLHCHVNDIVFLLVLLYSFTDGE